MVSKVQGGGSALQPQATGVAQSPAVPDPESQADIDAGGGRSSSFPDRTVDDSPLRARATQDLAWASQFGAWVHQRATYQVIGRHLSVAENKALANSQFAADAPEFQGADSTHRHAMRREGQSTEDAMREANAFVRDQFARAWQAESRIDALHEFGIALHALQDSTSPSHAGFQEWKHEPGLLEWGRHLAKEVINPGEGSELYRITQQAWDWFNAGELPAGNLFVFGCDGCIT